MKKSLLQKARALYQPKLPKGLQGAIKVKEGDPTQSVGDQIGRASCRERV